VKSGDQGAPREEDHLAIVMEIMGRIPDNVLNRSAAFKNFFCDNGNREIMLKHHQELKYWGLINMMIEKYHIEPPVAVNISDFIIGGLDLDPDKRITPVELLRHPWLRGLPCETCLERFTPPPQMQILPARVGTIENLKFQNLIHIRNFDIIWRIVNHFLCLDSIFSRLETKRQ